MTRRMIPAGALLALLLVCCGLVSAQPMPAPLPQITPPDPYAGLKAAEIRARIEEMRVRTAAQQQEMQAKQQEMDAKQREIDARTKPQETEQAGTVPRFDLTDGKVNGRAWLTWDASLKLGFSLGLANGLVYSKNFELFPGKYNYGEICQMLDEFYANPENRIIPIVMAVDLLARKSQKATTATDWDAMQTIARQLVAKQVIDSYLSANPPGK
jgi:hypothetical protein